MKTKILSANEFPKKYRRDKNQELFEKLIEMKGNECMKIEGVDYQTMRKIRIYLSNTKTPRSKLLQDKVFSLGSYFEVYTQKNEGLIDVFIRKIEI